MKDRKRTPDTSRVWGHGDFIHVCFESPGCSFRKAGYCIMCDYGSGDKITSEQALFALDHIIRFQKQPIRRLLLGTCGSIFDPGEMSGDVLLSVIRAIAKTDIESVIFETHYSFVSEELLDEIVRLLEGKEIAIELGFESSNTEVLTQSLKKHMDLGKLCDTIQMISKHKMKTILNVFLGAPGLSPYHQLEDALNSIHWAYDHGADEVVIFPANVKPNTVLWQEWEEGRYEIPSSWLLVELLRRLSSRERESVSISWYGDRQYKGIDNDIMAPSVCDECREELMTFYENFMDDFRAEKRQRLIDELIQREKCSCYNRLLEQLVKH